MEGPTNKGTVTPLSSMFHAEEAEKASKLVFDAISERRKELDQIREFVSDNNNLVNLVQRLPDELHHDIMVPFGKAAFFPGRLIHTNEFLVLLGEGYYADRTSKQTVEIFKRRGKVLESQVESLKAVIQDLKVEASFFDTTAAEAAEGLVEIREDYIEAPSSPVASIAGTSKPDSTGVSEIDNAKAAVEDKELARMLARMDELEKEEAEEAYGRDENEEDEADFHHHAHQLHPVVETSKAENTTKREFNGNQCQQDLSDLLNSRLEMSKVRPVSEDRSSRRTSATLAESSSTERSYKVPEVKENVQVTRPISGNEAFTGSIIERADNIETNPMVQPAAARSSKPVSRFKMQRR